MKICSSILAVLVVGVLCVDGATARSQHGRHHHAGTGLGPAATPPPDTAAKEGDNHAPDKAGSKGSRSDRAGSGSQRAGDRGTGVNGIDPDLIFVRPPKKAGKNAAKPAKPKAVDTAAARRAAERQRQPRPDLFGNVRKAAGTATPGVSGASVATRSLGAKDLGKAPGDVLGKSSPNGIAARGQTAGFAPLPPGTVGRMSAAKVFSFATPGPGAAAAGGKSLNGTGMGRPAGVPAPLGGPTRVLAGINGTGVHTKH